MKGCQKKVIFIKNTGSRNFDEAYFIISREAESSPGKEESLVSEANRIIERSIEAYPKNEKRGKKRILFDFFIPFSVGAFASAAIFFIVSLVSGKI